MSSTNAPRDGNFVPAALFQIEGAPGTVAPGQIDSSTGRILVESSSGSGSVTSVSVVTANGFAGTVANPTTTPAITLETTITGLLKGNGTAISAAVSDTDYQAPITLTTTGTSGAASFVSNTLNIPQYQAAGSYAPATSGTSILYGNGSGGFSNVTIGANLSFTGGTLAATGGGTGSNGFAWFIS